MSKSTSGWVYYWWWVYYLLHEYKSMFLSNPQLFKQWVTSKPDWNLLRHAFIRKKKNEENNAPPPLQEQPLNFVPNPNASFDVLNWSNNSSSHVAATSYIDAEDNPHLNTIFKLSLISLLLYSEGICWLVEHPTTFLMSCHSLSPPYLAFLSSISSFLYSCEGQWISFSS